MTIETHHHKSDIFAGSVVCKEPTHSNTKGRGETHLAMIHTGNGSEARPLTDEEMSELQRIAEAHDHATSGVHHIIIDLWGQR